MLPKIEHLHPTATGRADTEENLRLVCRYRNTSKYAKTRVTDLNIDIKPCCLIYDSNHFTKKHKRKNQIRAVITNVEPKNNDFNEKPCETNFFNFLQSPAFQN